MKKPPLTHAKPGAQSVPLEADVGESVHAVVEAVAGIRQALRHGGLDLADILEQGETLRELAHSDHRY